MSRLDAVLGSYGKVLRHRDFRLLMTSLATSMFGDWLFIVGLVTYVYEHTHSAGWLAALTVARQLPVFLLGPVAGALGDRMDRRRLMIGCDLIRAGLMGLLALTAATGGPVLVVVLLTMVSQVVGGPYLPAVTAQTPRLVNEKDLATANSLIGTIANLASIMGPLIGAIALLLGPVSVTFAVNGATFLVSAAIVTRIRGMSTTPVTATVERPGLLADARDGLQATTRNRPARAVMTLLAGTTAIYGAGTVLLAIAAARQFGSGSHGYGYLIGALGVGGLVALPLINRMSGSRRVGTLLYLGAVAMALPTALLYFVHELPAAVFIEILSGAALMLVDVTTITALQRSVPSELMARVFGVYDSFYVAGMALGALVAGPLVHAVGLPATFVVYGLGLPVLMLPTLGGLREIDRASARRHDELAGRVALLSALDLFTATPRGVVEELAAAAEEQQVPARTVVVREGDPADALYVVESGDLDVTATGERGEPSWINSVHAGGYFGELGLLLARPRTATVRAADGCRLLRIRAADFLAAVNGSPALAPVALEGMGQRLARTHPSIAMEVPLTLQPGEGVTT